MLRKIMAVAAVSGLALTSAMAQTSTTPSTSPSATPAPSASTTAPSTGSGAAHFVNKQGSDQWLFSKFKGTDVIGTDDKKIGDVSDVLFDKDKKIVAYIVCRLLLEKKKSKDVAIDPASFQMVSGKDQNDFKLRLAMTKDERSEERRVGK